jgi:hypothetical protein
MDDGPRVPIFHESFDAGLVRLEQVARAVPAADTRDYELWTLYASRYWIAAATSTSHRINPAADGWRRSAERPGYSRDRWMIDCTT